MHARARSLSLRIFAGLLSRDKHRFERIRFRFRSTDEREREREREREFGRSNNGTVAKPVIFGRREERGEGEGEQNQFPVSDSQLARLARAR